MRQAFAAMAVLTLAASPLRGQTFTVETISPAQVDLGQLVSAGNGDTVFRISATDGSVSKQSGQGTRQGTGMARALISLRCADSDDCETSEATVTISATGSPVGRAGGLTNFTIAPGASPPILGTATGSEIVTFTVSGIPRDQTRDIYLGADFILAASGTTGTASADYLVSVGSSTRGGTISATAWRPITLANLSALSFGRIIPPSAGTATILLDAQSGTRTVSEGEARPLPSPAPTIAQFRVSGEGGQSFAIDIPATFQITGPGGSLAVMTNSDTATSATLNAAQGAEGVYNFNVGGAMSLPAGTEPGAYSGSFQVSVHYN